VRTPGPNLDRVADEDKEFIIFKASSDVGKNQEMTIEYSQASNLEFMVRYGFKVENNPYGGRHFEL